MSSPCPFSGTGLPRSPPPWVIPIARTCRSPSKSEHQGPRWRGPPGVQHGQHLYVSLGHPRRPPAHPNGDHAVPVQWYGIPFDRPRRTSSTPRPPVPPSLQLQKSYLDGGWGGEGGARYSYDSEGRPCIQNVHHVEGSTAVSNPNTQWVTYDSVADSRWRPRMSRINPPFRHYSRKSGVDLTRPEEPTVITDVANVATTYTYDDQGRVMSVWSPGNPTVAYQYPVVSIGGGGVAPFKVTTNSQVKSAGLRRVRENHPIQEADRDRNRRHHDLHNPDADLQCVRAAGGPDGGQSGGHRAGSTLAYDLLDRVAGRTPFVGGGTTPWSSASRASTAWSQPPSPTRSVPPPRPIRWAKPWRWTRLTAASLVPPTMARGIRQL